MKLHAFVLFLSAICVSVESANILGVFPFPVKSHHILGSTLLKELASRGHNVTMMSCFPLEKPLKNYHDVYIDGFLEIKTDIMGKFYNPNSTLYDKAQAALSSFTMMSRTILENKNVQEFLESGSKFDLVIHLWALNEALLGIGHQLNATTIGFSTIGTGSHNLHATMHPSPYAYVPNTFLSLTDEMNFMERVLNTVVYLFSDLVVNFVHLPLQQRYLKQYFPNAPPLDELIDNVDLFLFNSHPSTESPRPYLPNMIQIGGFHLEQKQTLPEELKDFLDNSKNGVIYFSFGTNVQSEHLSEKLVNELIKGLGSLKYDVLWKFDYELKNLPRNFKPMKWIPQLAVLNHPNVKLFLTHGGLGSTVEAIYHGVPMIAVPFLGDQDKNTADIAAKKFGIKLNKDTLTSETLVEAIEEVLKNPVYLNAVRLQSDIYKNQEMNPMDKAVFWVEHALRHKGAKHLKASVNKLAWYQYMLVDVFLFLGLIAGVIVSFNVYVVKKIIACLCKSKKCERKNKNKKKAKLH